MAKKEEGLTYLQMPLPSASKKSKLVKKTWQGYNRRQTVDTGMLSVESNVSTAEAPYLVPAEKAQTVTGTTHDGSIGIGLFGFADFLIYIYGTKEEDDKYTIYIEKITVEDGAYKIIKGVLKEGASEDDCKVQRSVVQFNVYNVVTDPAEGIYYKKILVFPDKVSLDYEVEEVEEAPTKDDTREHVTYKCGDKFYRLEEDLEAQEKEVKEYEELPCFYLGNAYPDIKYATVHLSRLFGVDDGRVYASGFNDYANWNLDTEDEYNEANAWCSSSGANAKAGGEFTGITAFQGHVICFKKDFMHELYNTKNPFRIQDIYAEGCIDNRTIQDVDGQLIFVSEDNVKVYTGSNPRILSYNLGIKEYRNPVSGTDGRNYYLYCQDENGEGHVFVYDTFCSSWSRRNIDVDGVCGFAKCSHGMYLCCNDGESTSLEKLDTGVYGTWGFETDLVTNESCDIKHIEKLQMFCDISEGARLAVCFKYDNEEGLHEVWKCLRQRSDIQKVIRVKPRMTAHHGFKMRVEGYGFVRIRSMELLVQGGGDLYV